MPATYNTDFDRFDASLGGAVYCRHAYTCRTNCTSACNTKAPRPFRRACPVDKRTGRSKSPPRNAKPITNDEVIRLVDAAGKMQEFETNWGKPLRAYLEEYAHIEHIGHYVLGDLGIESPK